MASTCDHIDHVRTQLPYAVTCAILAAAAYMATSLEFSAWIVYPGVLALLLVVFTTLGRPIVPRSTV